MDGNDNKGPFRHSWWRILLIVFAVVAFIITCTFNGLAGAGPNGRNHFDRFQILEISILSYIKIILLGIFTRSTGSVSDQNLTDFTPAGKLINRIKEKIIYPSDNQGWTFAIWGVIYFWQAAWLIYALSRIPRKSNTGYLYIQPNTLHYSIFMFYILNMGLNIGWLIIWDRAYFGVG